MERFAALIDGLAERGYAVADGFIAPDVVAALAAEIDVLQADGTLRAAAVGRDAGRLRDADVRSDLTLWLDEATATPAQRTVLARCDELRTALNRELFLGLRELEAHLALYPAGARYVRHVDRHRDSDARVVSCVLYLNPTWDAAWGGALRIYDRDEPERVAREVVPRAGTFVCFLSDGIEHEVLPTTMPRKSIAGWFRR